MMIPSQTSEAHTRPPLFHGRASVRVSLPGLVSGHEVVEKSYENITTRELRLMLQERIREMSQKDAQSLFASIGTPNANVK